MIVSLADVVFGFLQMFLAQHGQKLPSELVQAGQAVVDSYAAHRDDMVTKANLEAQRG